MHDANIRMCTTCTDVLFKSNEIINTHKNIANRMFTLLMDWKQLHDPITAANMKLHLHIRHANNRFMYFYSFLRIPSDRIHKTKTSSNAALKSLL
jgi:hypothetical protein